MSNNRRVWKYRLNYEVTCFICINYFIFVYIIKFSSFVWVEFNPVSNSTMKFPYVLVSYFIALKIFKWLILLLTPCYFVLSRSWNMNKLREFISSTPRSTDLDIFARLIHREWACQLSPSATSSRYVGSFAKGVIIIPNINGVGMWITWKTIPLQSSSIKPRVWWG
jgi:hypothetical protein